MSVYIWFCIAVLRKILILNADSKRKWGLFSDKRGIGNDMQLTQIGKIWLIAKAFNLSHTF